MDPMRAFEAPPPIDLRAKAIRNQIVIRLVLVASILLSSILIQAAAGVTLPLVYLYYVVTGAALLSVVGVAVRSRLSTPAQVAIQVVGDLALTTGLVEFSGGPDSVFSFLYLVVIAVGAFLLSPRGAFATASIASLLFGGLLELTAYGILPAPPLSSVVEWSQTRISYTLAVNVFAFYLMAALVSYISEKLRSARRELDRRREDLARLQTLYANVIASMSSGLATTDLGGLITFLNRAGGEILHVDPEAAIGRPLESVGLIAVGEWNVLFELVERGEAPRAEREVAIGNTQVTIGYSLRRLRNGGVTEGCLVLFQDLTDLKKLEGEARFHEKLAAVGELAAGIAHEIRNPLASISGSVQLLRQEVSLDPGARRLMEIVVDESNRLSKILQDFLRYVRPLEREAEMFDIAQSLAEALSLFENSEEVSDRHRLELEIDPPSSTFYGDGDQIRQIFWNVAKNAIRAMPAGGELRVSGREEGDWYTIAFTDTGRGMTEEEQGRLFTPFSTAFDGGTGLGMAIVARIVERHQGHIEVESKPGMGTTVRIRLPRTRSARARSRAAEEPARASS
jgi:two-component system, NtrC family, sensor histidine kinase PilS